MKKFLLKISATKLEPIFRLVYAVFTKLEYILFEIKWSVCSHKKPSQSDVNYVCKNVTFMYKSFERQSMAKSLYKSIQQFYPGARVIIADDSKKPLDIKGDFVDVVQLPFNSGLSCGLNRALEKVTTPYLVRLDDDMLLTRLTDVEGQLRFLENHSEVSLVGFAVLTAPECKSPEKSLGKYYRKSYNKNLIIPRLTMIDNEHIVVEKSTNIFIARTQDIRQIGWDDNIRMIDHNEFFYRAAGQIVSVMAPKAVIFHRHNYFHSEYSKYRRDYLGDLAYIKKKHNFK